MGYKCYDGQLLLPFDMEWQFVERDPVSDVDPFYVDRETQIRSFIRAGERLQMARRESFEFPDGEVPPDVKVDPTSVLGFDLSDAFLLSKELQDKIAAAKSRKLAVEAEPMTKDEALPETESTT